MCAADTARVRAPATGMSVIGMRERKGTSELCFLSEGKLDSLATKVAELRHLRPLEKRAANLRG